MRTDLEYLAAQLAELGPHERLVVSMPPRHGMSQLATTRLREVLAEQGAKLLELSPPHGASEAAGLALADAWLNRPPPIPEDLMQHATNAERALCDKPECRKATSDEQQAALEAALAEREERARDMDAARPSGPKRPGPKDTPSPTAYKRRKAQAKRQRRSRRRNR